MNEEHKILDGPDHFPGDDWDCECGESFETKAEAKEHIKDVKYAASPEGKRDRAIFAAIRKEFVWPMSAYVENLWSDADFLANFPQFTQADLDKAQARKKEIMNEAN
jgi:hypothetical protein